MPKIIIRWFLIFVLSICIFSTSGLKVRAEGIYSNIGTSDAANGGNDAINFSQGKVWTIDKYGKYIWITQTLASGMHHWVWSNDLGTSWTQGSEDYQYLNRGSVAYDSINDKLHVIWAATDSNDGIIYRRYGITRDGSNNITSINREDGANINLQLQTSATRNIEQPVAVWVNDGSANGLLVAIWQINGVTISEIRGSMRAISLSAADGVSGNWQAIDGVGDTITADNPTVSADVISTAANNFGLAASMKVRGGSGLRKDDLYIFVHRKQDAYLKGYRAIWSSGNSDWSGGWQSPVNVGAIDDFSGYGQKEQLISQPVLDSLNDRLYIGWARWKDGSAGDTVSFAYLNSLDSPSATFDVYSANGTHAYAPTFDISYDSELHKLYFSYIESTTNGTNGSINYKEFDGSTLSTATRFYTSPGGSGGANGGADIPILYESRSSNNRLLVAFRVNGALPPTGPEPHTIYWGYVNLPTATPTPTLTPTPTVTPTIVPTSTPESSTQTSNSGPSSSEPTAPVCTNESPGLPDLFQIDVSNTQANIYFVPAKNSDNYYVAYGINPNGEQHGVQFNSNISNGVISYTINYLNPNTTYYFKLRGGNGCMPGSWSNIMQIKTRSSALGGKSYYKNFIAKVLSVFPKQVTNAGSTGNPIANTVKESQSTVVNCQTYTVKANDSLWNIAALNLGSGTKYTEIVNSNGLSTTVLRVGQTLKLGCN